MANALIIKNANFFANRVAVISFDGKPCTGIELAETSISIEREQPVTIEYTVTPSDTTDDVIWESSDTSVATIASNIVTIVGIGDTTITVSCGAYTDSLVMHVDLYEYPDWYLGSSFTYATDNYGNSTPAFQSAPSGSDTYNRLIGARAASDSDYIYRVFDSSNYATDSEMRPIKIPNNVGKIGFSGTNLYDTASGNAGVTIVFTKATESIIYNNVYPDVVKGIDVDYVTVTRNSCDGVVSVPDGADSFVIGARIKSAVASITSPDTVASNCDVVVHYLPPEE